MIEVFHKKSVAALYGLMLTSVMLTACSSDDADITTSMNDTPWDGRIVLSSNLTDVTRGTSVTHTTQGSNTVFAAGMNVDLFLSENGANTPTYEGEAYYLKTTTPSGNGANGIGNFSFYANSGRTGGAITKYWPASGNGLYFYAYYPAGAITGPVISTTTTLQTFTCAADQGADNGSLGSDLMFGVPSANPIGTDAANPIARPTGLTMAANAVNLNFTHCLSKVVVIIRGDGNGLAVDDAQLTGAKVELGNADMYNQASVVPNTGAATATGSANQTFTVKATTNTSLTNYCIIPPQLLTGKTIKVTLADGGSKTYTIPQNASLNVTATAGKVYTYTITVGLYSMSVSSTITDWSADVDVAETIYI